eukprot:TRINITY_DN3339_c0_g1_i1.p1 TRINITY_DN3339_c0_g1~~TRINITY_DN3339_c0_g1_i1.p1  ORF type:complete len:100 (+),score=33.61 TRINITY_DN3339_c0_g1_i1:143-442(+)
MCIRDRYQRRVHGDFELTIDIEKYLEILGEETKELDYAQFCTLLNEHRNINPSRYSAFLNKRHMSGAIQFFNQLEEEGEMAFDFEEEELKEGPTEIAKV